MKKIIFIGSGDFAAILLKALHEAFDVEIVAVLSQVDKPVGRKKVMTSTSVKKLALELGIDVLTVAEKSEIYSVLEDFEVDVFVVSDFGMIIPGNMLELPKIDTINVHPSLLPKYRGASPIQSALKNGDSKTGVCVIRLTEKMDAGPIYACLEVEIEDSEDFESLHGRLAEIGGQMLVSVLEQIEDISVINQGDGATYCYKIEKSDGFVDFESESAVDIFNKFRAFREWPGVSFLYRDMRFKIVLCEVINEVVDAGTFKILDSGLVAGCLSGSLLIKEFQPESKGVMKVADFLNGRKGWFS